MSKRPPVKIELSSDVIRELIRRRKDPSQTLSDVIRVVLEEDNPAPPDQITLEPGKRLTIEFEKLQIMPHPGPDHEGWSNVANTETGLQTNVPTHQLRDFIAVVEGRMEPVESGLPMDGLRDSLTELGIPLTDNTKTTVN